MKTKILSIATILFISVLLTSCDDSVPEPETGQVVFYHASFSVNTGTANIDGQSKTFTYHTSASGCGVPEDATFTLPVGTYSYSLSTIASSTSGQVTITNNGCAEVGW